MLIDFYTSAKGTFLSKRDLVNSARFFGTSVVLPFAVALILAAFGYFSFVPSGALSSPAPAKRAVSTPVSQPLFTDETFSRGINHQHNERSRELVGLDDVLGAGVCPLDANLDGWIDLFFVGGSGTHRYYGKDSWWVESSGNQLYLNEGEGYFLAVASDSGLQDPVAGMGCGTADLDNDGDHDIVLTALDGVYLYENTGNNRFKRRRLAEQAYWSTGVAFSDVDNDGLLDIYVANFIDYSHYSPKYEGFTGHQVQQDNNLDSRAFTPRPNFLLINQGALNFIDRAEEYGVANREGRSVFAAFHDINNDGRDDLLVGNKEGSRSKVYLYKKGKFEDQTTSLAYPFPKNYHDFTAANLSGDNDMELIFAGASGQPLGIYQRKASGYKDISSSYLKRPTAIYATEKFSVAALDLNGDGFADLAVSGGYAAPDLDSSAMTQGQQDLYLLNRGNTWGDIKRSGGRFPKSGRSLLAIDLDNDGDRDLVVTNNNDFPFLLINGVDGKNHADTSTALQDNNYLSTYHLSSPGKSLVPQQAHGGDTLDYPKFLALSLVNDSGIRLRQLNASFHQWGEGEQLRSLSRVGSLKRRELRLALLDNGLRGTPDVALYSARMIVDQGIPGFLDRILALAITSDDLYGCGHLQLIEKLFEIEERFIRQRKALAAALSAEVDHLPVARQICAAAALGRSRSKRPVDRLVDWATSSKPELSLTAIQALARLKHRDALKTLRELQSQTSGQRLAAVRQAIATIETTGNVSEEESLDLLSKAGRSCVPAPSGIMIKPSPGDDIYCLPSSAERKVSATPAPEESDKWRHVVRDFKRLATSEQSSVNDIALARLLMKDPPVWLAEEILRELLRRPPSSTIEKTLNHYTALNSIRLESRIIATSLLPLDDEEKRQRLAQLIGEVHRG